LYHYAHLHKHGTVFHDSLLQDTQEKEQRKKLTYITQNCAAYQMYHPMTISDETQGTLEEITKGTKNY